MKSKTASRIVTRIIEDITDRKGLGNAFEECEVPVQEEMAETWKAIVLDEANREANDSPDEVETP